MRGYVRLSLSVLGVTVLVTLPLARLSGGQARYDSGQNVVPAFEGWEKNPDGTFNLVFGYMNRNYEETPEIPIGPDNNFSPGPADRGQPTFFYPRRQWFMFKVRVPADFGKQDLVWSLTRNGRTEKAHGHLLLEYELTPDVLSSDRQGTRNIEEANRANLPPTISLERPAERLATVGSPLVLTASAADDGLPKWPERPRPQRRSEPSTAGAAPAPPPIIQFHPQDRPELQAVVHATREGLAVTWVHWRGPGQIHFEPGSSLVKNADGTTTPGKPTAGKVTTNVTFDEPGTYVIRAYADDGIQLATADVTVRVEGTAPANK